MLVESIFFVLLAFLILLLLVVGFETVGFRLSEALLIFVGSTLLFFSFDPSILLYVDGSLGIGIFVPLYIAVFQPFLVVGSSNGLAIGPGLFELIYYLGRQRTKERLEKWIK